VPRRDFSRRWPCIDTSVLDAPIGAPMAMKTNVALWGRQFWRRPPFQAAFYRSFKAC
jgi:hypothetical protein